MDSSGPGVTTPSVILFLSWLQARSPDVYRGKYRADHPDPATAYAEEVRDMIHRVHENGGKVQSEIRSSAEV